MVIDRLEVSYCEGWDPQARRAAGPVSSARTAERDRTGEQYAVVLAMSGQPLAVIEVAWANVYCAVWFLDERLRRFLQVDCRRLAGDRLFVISCRQWAYTEAGQAEFDEDVTWGEFETSLDGRQAKSVFHGSADPAEGLAGMVMPESNWLDAPTFGDWGRFIRAFPGHLAALGHEVPATAVIEDVSDPRGEGLPAGMRPWHPPRPLQPRPPHLELLFSPGAMLVVGEDEPMDGVGGTVIVEVQKAGTLRMPSGGLVACDPSWMHPGGLTHPETCQPFTATVAPGEYPVLLSVFRWVSGQGPIEAAAKLVIRDEPVVSWEMGLRPGQDLTMLPDEGFFGFGVDAGTGCFFDAIAAPAMARLTRGFTLGYERTAELRDPESGANMIAFHSGWGDGSYPTWIGRAASGDVACFIADMQLFGKIDPDPGPDARQAQA